MCSGQDSYNKHVNTHQESTAQKRALSADSFNEEEQEETTRNNLDDTEEATKQKSIFASADSVENLGRDCNLLDVISRVRTRFGCLQ